VYLSIYLYPYLYIHIYVYIYTYICIPASSAARRRPPRRMRLQPGRRRRPGLWFLQDTGLLLYVCARINRPFFLPARLHCPHCCNTIARPLGNTQPPTRIPLCMPYTIQYWQWQYRVKANLGLRQTRPARRPAPWPLHDIAIPNIVWCIEYNRGVGSGEGRILRKSRVIVQQ